MSLQLRLVDGPILFSSLDSASPFLPQVLATIALANSIRKKLDKLRKFYSLINQRDILRRAKARRAERRPKLEEEWLEVIAREQEAEQQVEQGAARSRCYRSAIDAFLDFKYDVDSIQTGDGFNKSGGGEISDNGGVERQSVSENERRCRYKRDLSRQVLVIPLSRSHQDSVTKCEIEETAKKDRERLEAERNEMQTLKETCERGEGLVLELMDICERLESAVVDLVLGWKQY